MNQQSTENALMECLSRIVRSLLLTLMLGFAPLAGAGTVKLTDEAVVSLVVVAVFDQGLRICRVGGARVRINSSVNFDISSLTHQCTRRKVSNGFKPLYL